MTGRSPRIFAVTLASGGSKSVPLKNIRPIKGIPLIAYTIAEAIHSKLITRYIVSTDDERIKEVAINYGAEVPFLRPAHLASDTATSLDAIQHAVVWAEEEESEKYDYVVELMATNPMKTSEDIDMALGKLIDTGADSVIGVIRLQDHHPIRIKKIVDDRIEDFCLKEIPETRRQDLKPDAYIRNGSIYAVKRDLIMKANSRYGTYNSRPYIFPEHRSVNIDIEIDFLVAEALLAKENRDHIRLVK